jgi:branched-chain amino acid transport system substrate-binding protein
MFGVTRICAAALVLVLSPREPVRAAQPQRMILFGCPIALTGPLAKEGHLEQEGYDAWVRYVNGHGGLRVGRGKYSVAIRYIDDASTPATTARAAEQLISRDHVNFLLGPYGSAATFAAAAIAERHAIPMISSSGSAERTFDQGYQYVFGVQTPARKYLIGMIEFAVRRTPRLRTVAISSASDEFSREVQQGAVQSANDHGFRVVYAKQYAGDSASIDAAAAAITGAHPDIVLNAGHLQDAIALHRALLRRGGTAKFYGYTIGPETPDFRTALGAGAQGVLGSAQWSPTVSYVGNPGFYRTATAYTAAFTHDTGQAPTYQSAEATAAGVAFADAITAAGSLEPNAVRTALSRLNVVTFFGPIRFDERGVNVYKPMVINQIQGSRLMTVYPYRLAAALPIDALPIDAQQNDAAQNPSSGDTVAGRSADIITRDFRIETDQTESDLNNGSFSMPHRVRFIRPGTDVVGDSATGNTRSGLVIITGHAIFRQNTQPSHQLAGATASGSSATLLCDELRVDSKRKLYVATGNVVYVQGSRRATAQNGRLDQAAHVLVLNGNVQLADGEQILTGQTIHYDTLTEKVLSNANQ